MTPTDSSDTPTAAASSGAIERARRIASVMDRAYLDPILGFVAPGIGDILSAVFGLYVVAVAVREKLPALTISRMLMNLGIDAAVGAIPVLGDLFDFGFKAHSRNLKVLEERSVTRAASAGDWLYILGAIVALVAAVAIPIYIAVRVLQWLF